MEEIKCIFCNSDRSRVVIQENGYKGRKCSKCGLIYVSPRPSPLEIKSIYSHDAAKISVEDHINKSLSKRICARHHLQIIRSFVKTGELLEIGSGAGYFLDEAQKKGFKVLGIELNPDLMEFIRKEFGIHCLTSPLAPARLGFNRFDLVYHRNVISHLYDPINEFKKIYQVMKAGAFLVFETGNLGEVSPLYFKYIRSFQLPDHLFFFNLGNLKELLRKTGFEFISAYRYSLLPSLRMIQIIAYVKDLCRLVNTTFIGKKDPIHN
ncbi:MAG: class I SAM-dependent methyltransferase, partial [Deltaproteobacteria bacterium]|nr:class I SAM-dependent methyltransferase [Deltaproteobacteria bacterium]